MTVAVTTYLTIILILYHSGSASSNSISDWHYGEEEFISSRSIQWHYGDEENWPSECKEGKKQSPIALSPEIAEPGHFSVLIFDKYNETYPVQSKNNGHSAEVRLHVQVQPSVRGGGLPHIYVLDHLHFHWSSEHTISNYRFPLEMHLVHYAREYHNVSNALRYYGGLAVFAVLFDLSPDDDIPSEPLIDVIDKLHNKAQNEVEQMTFTIQDYLPRDIAGYYRYNGSITTPGCTEGVIWTVFTNTLPISKAQVSTFGRLKSGKVELHSNYRSLQALHGRRVLHKVSPIHSNSNKIYISVFNIWLLFMVVFKFI